MKTQRDPAAGNRGVQETESENTYQAQQEPDEVELLVHK